MSLQNTTRSGGTAPGLPGSMLHPEALSRRNALGAAAAIALSLAALGGAPVAARAAPVAIAAPASPDADLIARAGRLVSLAQRCRATGDRRATIEDRVFKLCSRPEPLPQPTCFSFDIQEPNSTKRIFTATKSPTFDHEQAEWERATAAARLSTRRSSARRRHGSACQRWSGCTTA